MSDFVPSFGGKALARAAHTLVEAIAARPLGTGYRAVTEPSELTSYVSALALDAGFNVEHVDFYERDLEKLLEGSTPFLFVPLPAGAETYAVVRGGRRELTLLDGLGRHVQVPRAAATHAFADGSAERMHALAARLGRSGVGNEARLARALRDELGAAAAIGWGYVFRRRGAESVPQMVAGLRLGNCGAKLLALSGVQSALTTLGWAVIGSLAVSGHAETGSLLGWALLSITATFVQVIATRFVGRFTIRAATMLRERLLEGALKLEPEGLGAFGLGGLMVIATQADSFLNSVIALFLALIGVLTNLVATAAVLSIAPLPGLTLTLMLAFLVGVLAAAPRVAASYAAQQKQRMGLTTDMVERMLGHRTRLVQQTPNSWHEGEDEALIAYGDDSRRLDRVVTLLRAVPRTYYALSMVALFLVLVSHPTQLALALSIGGMTLGMATLGALVELVLAGGALYALWRAIQPVVQGPDVAGETRTSPPVIATEDTSGSATVVELRGVSFTYPHRTKAVLDDACLAIRTGERVLIEGASGGGKTTVAALLTGIRAPDAGLVLVRGVDQHTIREHELRRTISSAPQFYKNHVFSESLAFNLLLGRAWPPSPEDISEAKAVTTALGLGPLLARMPAGLHQHVGDTGWQLSHGEKSRVYLARALLQRANLLVLDETFGALDPENLAQCMSVVLDRAESLAVVTHR
jgi:ATP-binding cassette, subfamily B, bacterial